jgi:hypothetical protein
MNRIAILRLGLAGPAIAMPAFVNKTSGLFPRRHVREIILEKVCCPAYPDLIQRRREAPARRMAAGNIRASWFETRKNALLAMSGQAARASRPA